MDNRVDRAIDTDDTDALSAFWDAVARGVPDPPTAGLDPETVALVRRVRRAARAEVPAGGRERALAAAMRELAGHGVRLNGHERGSAVTTSTILRTDPRYGRPATLPIPVAPRRRLGSAVSLAATAVLLLVIAGGLVALRFGAPGSDGGRAVSIPAPRVSPEATPPAGVPLRTLVIPAAYLPAGEIWIGGWVYNQAPGTTQTFTYLPWDVSIEVVSTGSYGVTSDGPRLIWRGGTDAPPEEVAAGAEGIVGPGDAIAYLDDAPQTARVIGDDPAVALAIGLFGRDGDAGFGATGDATVALRRVTLAPGAALPSAGETLIERFVEAGVLTWEVIPAGETTPQPGQTYSGYVTFTPLPGATVVVRNDGDEPLVFLEATITLPTPAGTPAAGTPTG